MTTFDGSPKHAFILQMSENAGSHQLLQSALEQLQRRRMDILERAREHKKTGVRPVPRPRNACYINVNIYNAKRGTKCNLRAVVNTGYDTELIIPKHIAQELELEEQSRYDASGFEEGTVNMIEYKSCLVEIPCYNQGHLCTCGSAPLTALAKDVPRNVAYDEDLSTMPCYKQTIQSSASEEGRNVRTIQLDPTHPRKPASAVAVLGITGLYKLGFALDATRPVLREIIPTKDV